MKIKLFPAFTTLLIVSSCVIPFGTQYRAPILLASFTENDVRVSIQLDNPQQNIYRLSATFMPPEGYHLYSKDIPLTGIDGLGRPTLLELTPNSQIKSLGELIESVEAEEPNFEPRELMVYPSGIVTLSLPIELPQGADWVDETVSITYMSCSERGCKAPVIGKRVNISVPGADTFAKGQ